MTTEIIYRVKTTAKDSKGLPVKFESFNRAAAMAKATELKGRDPRARVLGVPLVGR